MVCLHHEPRNLNRWSGEDLDLKIRHADRSSGIAGSLAERLPIIHIVGAPSTALQVSV